MLHVSNVQTTTYRVCCILWLALLSHSFLRKHEPPTLFTKQVFEGIPKSLIHFLCQCSVIESVLKTCCGLFRTEVATYKRVMYVCHKCWWPFVTVRSTVKGNTVVPCLCLQNASYQDLDAHVQDNECLWLCLTPSLGGLAFCSRASKFQL